VFQIGGKPNQTFPPDPLFLVPVVNEPFAVPLRTVTARMISKALVKYVTLFGLPKVIQSNQGTNFTSRIFSQLLKHLHISIQSYNVIIIIINIYTTVWDQ